MGCGIYWQQIHEVERALGTMERFGISTTDPAYLALSTQRGALMAQVGQKFPRVNVALSMWREFSPERIRIRHDIETGWFSEARERPGAPPIYKRVPDEVAMAILKGEVTPELKQQLFAPDPYLGE